MLKTPRMVGLRDALLILIAPRTVFQRIEDTAAYARVLAAMLALWALIGWVTIATGLPDREVDRQTEKAIAALEREQGDSLSRVEFTERREAIDRTGQFSKMIMRGVALVAAPLQWLAAILLIASLLFAVVALAGNKPEYHTLVAICVYASVPELLAAALRLGMMLYYRTIDVDTSVGLLVGSSESMKRLHDVLAALDPFRVWSWVLVGLGLIVTRQLRPRAAIVATLLFGAITAGVRMIPLPVAAAVSG